jgi:hypothetical protein
LSTTLSKNSVFVNSWQEAVAQRSPETRTACDDLVAFTLIDAGRARQVPSEVERKRSTSARLSNPSGSDDLISCFSRYSNETDGMSDQQLRDEDPASRTLFARIGGVEAMHWALLRSTLGEPPIPESLLPVE